MKTYIVEIPLTGYVSVEVEAESEQEAIDRAFEEAQLEHIEEWDLHRQIVRGNVFSGLRNEIHVEEIDDDDED
ncbi:hypothetical protein [Alicyclobacillus acidoterrestris]|uniref:Uncharacterized protein n=2 Tax=root TaxID=1 RepID=T0C500_ALIAG|nr:hypothetical protein [Alicyclobacillus acidoterrestris]EPZ47610.1 hypothetical protein N007_05395 [Alicyclobacillus acidoterrestris ATCC 49025]UNO47994.1 hypothetical protein K1I37_15070 [Alicyclobacillus acidoterrestris]WJJ55368.1 hypothetical protein QB910_000124 [Alicyclobacillus phage KKP 3916]